MTFTEILSAIQLKPKYILPIIIFSGLIVFSPCVFLTTLGIQKLANEYRSWIGIAFLASSVLLISHGIVVTFSSIRQKIGEQHRRKINRKRLHQLSPGEIEVLSFYIIENTRTKEFDPRNGVIIGLEKADIIYKAERVGVKTKFLAELVICPFNIYDWAWNYLNEHKELLTTNAE